MRRVFGATYSGYRDERRIALTGLPLYTNLQQAALTPRIHLFCTYKRKLHRADSLTFKIAFPRMRKLAANVVCINFIPEDTRNLLLRSTLKA